MTSGGGKRQPEDFRVSGTTDEGFENVRNLFRQNFADATENCASLCVYFKGRKVVDLTGKRKPEEHPDYDRDSLQVVFSSSKVVSAIVVAKLVDEGRLDYKDKVRDVWPEFEAAGDILVEDVLRHDAGLPAFDGIGKLLPLRDFRCEQLKRNSVGSIIEKQTPKIMKTPSGRSIRMYHAITRDIILNELVRRADVKRRTMGEFIRDEFRGKHPECDIFCGEDVKDRRLADLSYVAPWNFAAKSLLPQWAWLEALCGDERVPSAKELFLAGKSVYDCSLRLARKSGFRSEEEDLRARKFLFSEVMLKQRIFRENLLAPEVLNSRRFLKAQIPSVNVTASARGLALLGAYMANRREHLSNTVKGKLRLECNDEEEDVLLSEETWRKMHGEPVLAYDGVVGFVRTEFTAGGVNLFRRYDDDEFIESYFKKGRDGYYGWIGLGGSAFLWNPECRVSFAYTPTNNAYYDPSNGVSAELLTEVNRCVRHFKTTAEKGRQTSCL